nr:OadG family transporter subunit [uncultured Blautia sp.]
MKQIFKKVSSLCTVLLMMAVLTLTGASSVWAEEIDDTVKQTLVTTAEGLTDTIVALGDEDIENYSQSSDAFTVSAMSAWAGSKSELGALKERTGETEVKASDDGYTVTVPASFEKADANFVYVFDASTGAPTSLTVDVQYSMAETLRRAVMNTIMGIAIVFIILIFLSFLIYLFRFIPNPEAKKKAQAAAPAPAAPAPVAVQETADDTELIAVIAAAIAAAEGTTTDGFVVRSIRKINRKKR